MKSTSLLTGETYDTEIQTVKLFQLVTTDWGGYSAFSEMVVTGINHGVGGYTYELIDIHTKEISTTMYICPESEHWGVGTYYNDQEPEFMEPTKALALKAEAKQLQAEKEKAEQKEREYRAEKQKIGRKRLEELIPADAKAIIIAEIKTEKEKRMVILGFSSNKRNNFAELRKFAPRFEPTQHLSEYNEDYEDRHDYILSSGGWFLRKEVIVNRDVFIDLLSYTAGFEENICLGEPIQPATTEATEPAKGRFEIVDYSAKALAVFGDTKMIKDQLYEMGGRFNKFLTHNNIKQAGWIFSKNKKEELHKLLD